jgi:hypothetical protein
VLLASCVTSCSLQWVWEATAGSHSYKVYADAAAGEGDNLVRGTR